MTAHAYGSDRTPAEQLALLEAFVASRPRVVVTEDAFDGDEGGDERVSDREADRRAGWHYPEGP